MDFSANFLTNTKTSDNIFAERIFVGIFLMNHETIYSHKFNYMMVKLTFRPFK